MLSQGASFVRASPLAGAVTFRGALSFLSGAALLCTEEILMPAWIISKTPIIREVRNYQPWLTSLLKGGENTLVPPQTPLPRLRSRTPADPQNPTVTVQTPQHVVTPRPPREDSLCPCWGASEAVPQSKSKVGRALVRQRAQPAWLSKRSAARGQARRHARPPHRTQLWFKITSLKKQAI